MIDYIIFCVNNFTPLRLQNFFMKLPKALSRNRVNKESQRRQTGEALQIKAFANFFMNACSFRLSFEKVRDFLSLLFAVLRFLSCKGLKLQAFRWSRSFCKFINGIFCILTSV